MDELTQAPAEAEKPSSSGAKGPIRAYHETVLYERQPRLCDLIPVRPATLTTTLLGVLTAAAAVVAIYIHAANPGGRVPALLAPFDVMQRGGLAGWSLSLILAAGTGYALVIYSIRSHRIDDYRGGYRVWLWTAAALLLASLDSATGLCDALGALGAPAGRDAKTTAQLVWMGGYTLAFGTLALRLSLELRASRLTLTAASAALVCLLAAAAIRLGAAPLPGATLRAVALVSCQLLASTSILAALLLYARHVYLDAEGRLMIDAADQPKAKRKPRSRAKLAVVADAEEGESPAEAASEAKPAESRSPPAAKGEAKPEPKTDSKPKPAPPKFGGGGPLSAALSAANAAAAEDEDDEEDSDEDENERLSKSERRRLKKLARRDPTRRAA